MAKTRRHANLELDQAWVYMMAGYPWGHSETISTLPLQFIEHRTELAALQNMSLYQRVCEASASAKVR